MSKKQDTLDRVREQATRIPNLSGLDLRVALVELTPELAACAMARNDGNRNIRPSHVKFLAEMIAGDQYKLNGETIVLSRNDKLLDGQHRCEAVTKTGLSILTLIVWGIEDESQDTIGLCQARTAGDTFNAHGIESYNRAAAIARMLWIARTERYSDNTAKPPRRELLDIYRDFEEHLAWAASAFPATIQPGIKSRGAPVAAGFALGHLVSPGTTEGALQRFVDGTAARGTGAELLRRVVARETKQWPLFCCTAQAVEMEMQNKRGGLLRAEGGENALKRLSVRLRQ